MLLGLAPPARMTFLSADVDSVVGMRKMKTALVLEPASRVRSPAITEGGLKCQMTRVTENTNAFRCVGQHQISNNTCPSDGMNSGFRFTPRVGPRGRERKRGDETHAALQ